MTSTDKRSADSIFSRLNIPPQYVESSTFDAHDERTLTFFVHIPKTGGTSLRRMLHRFFPKDAVYPSGRDVRSLPDTPLRWLVPYVNIGCLRRLSTRRRGEIRFVSGHLPYCVGALFDRPICYLSFFRHPVARAISELKHTRTVEKQYRSKSIDEIAADEDFFNRRIRDVQTRYFAHQMKEDLVRASDQLDLTSADIDRARRRIAKLDFLGLLEDYGGSIAMLKRQFNLAIEKVVRRRVNYEECATPSGLAERIARECVHDMELYEYVKELYFARRRQLFES